MTYVGVIKYGQKTEILWFRTYVPSSIPNGDNESFFYNMVIVYWTLISIYMQFEYQYPKSSNVSVEHVHLLRGAFGFLEPREMLKSYVARGLLLLLLLSSSY